MVEIDLPRPRGEATRNDPKFTEYNKYLRGIIGEKERKTSGTPENHRGIRAFRRRVYRALVDLRCGKACPGVHPAVSAEGLEQPCQNVCKGTVYAHLWTTTYEVILGFVIGAFLGIVLGYVFIKIDALKTMLMPYLIFFRRHRRSHLSRYSSYGSESDSYQRLF